MIRINVPGVAEDFPLVSIGDFVRLIFRNPLNANVSTEVIGEVADVVVKTEEVTIRLPSPFQQQSGRPFFTANGLPYLQALLHTEHAFIDASSVLQYFPRLPDQMETHSIRKDKRSEVFNQFRFDVRFGFVGGRGFDIVNQVLGETLSQGMTNIQSPSAHHLVRCLAPTGMQISEMQGKKKANVFKIFHNPINHEQGKAVLDIVYNNCGGAPYIIEGPAGTGEPSPISHLNKALICFFSEDYLMSCAVVSHTKPLKAKACVCAKPFSKYCYRNRAPRFWSAPHRMQLVMSWLPASYLS